MPENNARTKNMLPKVDPHAISIRSGSVGTVTVICDQQYSQQIRDAAVDVVQLALTGKPAEAMENLKAWCQQGRLQIIQAHPEIVDSDAVPNLDIVWSKQRQPGPPADGIWYDPVIRYLDLPSGVLRVDYHDEQVEQEHEPYVMRTQQDEAVGDDDYEDASIYLVHGEPGFYQVTIFTRAVDLEDEDDDDDDDDEDDETIDLRYFPPQLAIYLTRIQRPEPLPENGALVPIHPPQQDLYALKRRSAGLPPVSNRIANQRPKVTGDGRFTGRIMQHDLFGLLLEFPENQQRAFGLEPGGILELNVFGEFAATVTCVVSPEDGFSPTVWSHVERLRRKPGNFATLKPRNNVVVLELLKQSRSQPLNVPEHEMAAVEVKKVIDASSGQPMRFPLQQSAADSPDTVEVPKRVGQPGPKVDRVIDLLQSCDAWTQACLLDVEGETRIGAVQVFPPKKWVDRQGKEKLMAAEVHAHISDVRGETTENEISKTFRGFPGGVQRAFSWVARQARGGRLWMDRFEVDFSVFDGKPTIKKAEAKSAAREAWLEVLAIEEQ